MGSRATALIPSLVAVTKKCKYKTVLNLNGFKGDSPHPFLGSSYQGTQKFSFKEELFQ